MDVALNPEITIPTIATILTQIIDRHTSYINYPMSAYTSYSHY